MGRDHLVDTGKEERATLEWLLNKWGVMM